MQIDKRFVREPWTSKGYKRVAFEEDRNKIHREQKNKHVYFEQSKTEPENEITRNHVLKLGELHSNPLLGDGLFSSEEWQHANGQTIRARAIDFKGV
ncbi:hypothetical protein CDAR_24501 [Caerostris darwini]|uniref:Uncharacterized protein n=1 Tax=Caerostris darwini TaxID=1538125 RepID=A0AAV4SGV7_9ARAC|nr:hypothetical protein CDAR_24501 [Caerostris darwini]